MNKIAASLVKKLRERTSLGIIDCQKALNEANGDIELAIENMRRSGIIKAGKKAGNISAEGVIKIKIDRNFGVILEINCQTDFVAKNKSFQVFAEKVLDTALDRKIIDFNILKSEFEEERVKLVAQTGENINIRRMAFLEGKVIGSYLHGSRIGVLVSAKGEGVNERLVKHIAMHIAASKPEFMNPEDVSTKIIQKEYQIQLDSAMRSNKPKEIIEEIVKGRMKKFVNEISLTGQNLITEPSKTVGQFLKENHAFVTNFIRFEVSEGISKVENDFADEVAAISQQY